MRYFKDLSIFHQKYTYDNDLNKINVQRLILSTKK